MKWIEGFGLMQCVGNCLHFCPVTIFNINTLCCLCSNEYVQCVPCEKRKLIDITDIIASINEKKRLE